MWLWLWCLAFADDGRGVAFSAQPTATQVGVRLPVGRSAFDVRAGPTLAIGGSTLEQTILGPNGASGVQTVESKSISFGLGGTVGFRSRLGDAPVHGWWFVNSSVLRTWDRPQLPTFNLKDPAGSSMSVQVLTGPGVEAPLGEHWTIGLDLGVLRAQNWNSTAQQNFGGEFFPFTSRGFDIGLGGGFSVLLQRYPR